MKKSVLVVSLAFVCACTTGLVGCGGGNTNANNANTNTAATASVATNAANTSNTSNAASTAASSNTSSAASTESGTPEAAVAKATDEGVTALSFDQMQDLMDNTLDVGMTLSDVRSAMGGVNGTLMGDGYEANTYAWYTADKANALIATFTSQDGSGTLTSCEIGID